ncbi:Dyp-type peroxidase [Nocardioides carbamazepini]|uniref:Dyp-type peroxidase n=1 Tax=Nocardioides carbamazepini TaxID=2854259 RepID=UPI00214A1583|nr:Dyp-type peroxidase [Nocardioides carbamazepini]MCR1784379.1 Dyp-type peroxidase [Nocardioides carbamazepini]
MSGGPRWDRRRVLRTGAAAFGGAGAGWSGSALVANGSATAAPADGRTPVVGPSAGAETVPVVGTHQPGVDTAPQAHLALVGWSLRAGTDGTGLIRMMRLLSDDAARLATGTAALADTEPELAAHPARLTVTFGFGPRVLRELVPAARRPGLTDLPPFGRDRLDPRWGQTDVVAQICCDDPTTLAHARRMLVKDARTFAEVRWIQAGFRTARGTVPDGTTMRNLMGQVDGTVNPAPAEPDFAPLVWAEGDGGDGGFAGGTFLVVRRIRMQLEKWDRVDRVGREVVVGRRLDTGAPLTGEREFDEPDFAATDRFGFPVIDPASHIARARSADPGERFLRRAYNYTEPDPARSSGEDSGLVFLAFAADPARQFVPVQRRLDQLDRLNDWVVTIGSAVYAVPPAAPPGGYVGQQLLEGIESVTTGESSPS